MCRRVFRHSPTAQPPHVILNWLQNPLRRSRNVILCPYLVFQDLLIITNKEILNSDNSRELSRLTFQNDMKKIPLLFPL